ncbi:MAG: flagellar hook-basal body complex protein FliE [Chloroflexota bacterium]
MALIGPVTGVTSVLSGSGASAVSGVNSAATSIGGVGAPAPATTAGTDASSSGNSFLDQLGNALGQLNAQVNGADGAMASFAAGGSADIHTVMLELQQASIGLKTGIAVRDKLLEAYQDLMRIQV